MFRSENGLTISATDVAHFLDCRHLIALDLGALEKRYDKPRKKDDPLVALVVKRGMEHEQAFVDTLIEAGRDVVRIATRNEQAVADTLAAIQRGAEVIVQGALRHDQWFGYTDIMIRTDTPSALGNWSYEVADTKLARETRAGTVMQLGVYSAMLSQLLGTTPERFHVVVPGERGTTVQHTYRTDDYAAYLRFMQAELMAGIALGYDALADANYPEPVEHCDVCAWWRRCNDKRHTDDHLSLVAGLGRLHRRELARHDFDSLTKLAGMVVPVPFRPSRGSRESYERAQQQAFVQLRSRETEVPLHALRPVPVVKEGEPPEPYGLSRLPDPSPGDVFLDLEGDQFADDVGREYLFGIATVEGAETRYRSWWAITMREEREAFESVMDFIMDRLERFPDMHVYHYAAYEPTAFKRLMGRHAVREAELDRLLRGRRFVDLYAVVKQAMWIGVESYSIKQLEPCYGYKRKAELPEASQALRNMEYALQVRQPDLVTDEDRRTIEIYNRDDCVSTLWLRDWLERVRSEEESKGNSCPRPVYVPDEPSEDVSEKALRVQELREPLLAGVPDENRDAEHQARWIMAYLLDFHRREDKATWWEYFRLRELPDEDLIDERNAVAGLDFVEQVSSGTGFYKNGKPRGPIVDRYRYPEQEVDFNRGDKLRTPGDGKSFAIVVSHDRTHRLLDLEKSRTKADEHPAALFAFDFVPAGEIEESLMRLGEEVARAGSVSAVTSAAAELLLRNAPRLSKGERFERQPDEDATAFSVRMAALLDRSILAIQGPPGSGKTFTGAEMICSLVAQGKRVGVTATGHKVIRNLLEKCGEHAHKKGLTLRIAHKDDKVLPPSAAVTSLSGNDAPLAGLHANEIDVLGGTAWLWSRDEYAGAVDVLFVDEAGQMSLANVAAIAQGAKAIVLLGDPQQLDQPTKGTHPDGVGVSALRHILGSQRTIDADRGIFLPMTRRLAPSICDFTSELYYERRLTSKPGLERQTLIGAAELSGAGLRIVAVEHDGNRNCAPEEVATVADLVTRLTSGSTQWVDEDGNANPITLNNILVVSPYNSQVNHLLEALPQGARVGTVDKFQGQQAPVVIYSMATSRPEDAPRGMEFLYSQNRLNVATSRAQCAVFLVASPHLFRPECRSVRQIKLANGLCRFRELATPVQADNTSFSPAVTARR